jgi:hypothetical protein
MTSRLIDLCALSEADHLDYIQSRECVSICPKLPDGDLVQRIALTPSDNDAEWAAKARLLLRLCEANEDYLDEDPRLVLAYSLASDIVSQE